MARMARCTICVGAVSVLLLSGCAVWAGGQKAAVGLNYPHATGETLTQSSSDHYRYVSSVAAHDSRALVDDLDLFFMTDRPTRLTRWHDR